MIPSQVTLALVKIYGRMMVRPSFSIDAYLRAGGKMHSIQLRTRRPS